MNTETQSLDRKQFPETAALSDWFKSEKDKGLCDVKFFPAGTEKTTAESFCAEVNKAKAAEVVNDPEFF